MRYSEDLCRTMVIEQSAAGPTTYYPYVGGERGYSLSINDSAFGDGAGGVRTPSRAYIHALFISGDSYHSDPADFDFSVSPPGPLVRSSVRDEVRILDHDDVMIFHALVPTSPIANVHPIADPLGDGAGYIAAANAKQSYPELCLSSKRGFKVEVERVTADSGLFICTIVWRSVR